MSRRTIRDWPSTSPRWTNSTGTSAVKLAWGTWRVSIGRVPPSDLDLTRAYDRASARWSLISAILGYSLAYPELFAWVQANAGSLVVAQAAYNAGQQGFFCYQGDNIANGIVLPDHRGTFPRAFDNGRGFDAGRNLCSLQDWAEANHSHTFTDPGHDHWIVADHTKMTTSGGSSDLGTPGSGGTNSQIYNPSDHVQSNTTGASVGFISGFAGANLAGEVRVKNYALRFCLYTVR